MSGSDDRIYSKLERISDDLSSLKVIAAKQEQNLLRQAADLEKHIKRSDLLENQVQDFKSHIDAELEPLKDHVKYMNWGLKIFGGIAALATFALTLLQITSWMKDFIKGL